MAENTYRLGKLVRDKSVTLMEGKGTKVEWHTLQSDEKVKHLLTFLYIYFGICQLSTFLGAIHICERCWKV